jgi:c-di-GMP-binding flagellar brake protein YcgR
MDGEARNVEGKDRRRYPRVKANVSVELHGTEDATPSRVSIVEISLCGCYIETMFTMAVGEKAFLTLWLNEQSIRTTAIVATRHPQVGNGFEFIDMSPGDRLRLSEFIYKVSSETNNP